MTKAAHHRGNYTREAAAVRHAAYANPTTRCGKCGLTLTEGRQNYGATAAAWTAGHINAGQIDGPLQPEHARCNYSDGARIGNMRRTGNTTSRAWR